MPQNGVASTLNLITAAPKVPFRGSLTYSEKHHHAEHRQQGGDNHAEERRQLLGLLAGALPRVPRVLLRAMAAGGRTPLGLIDAGGEAVVEERSSLRHGESCPFAGVKTSWDAFRQPTPVFFFC